MKKETGLICMQGSSIGCTATEGSDWSPHRSTQDPSKECSFSTASHDSNNTTIPVFDDVCSQLGSSSQPFSIVIPSLRQSPTPLDLTNSLPCEASASSATSLSSFLQPTSFSPPTNPKPNPFLDAPLMLRAVSLEPSPSESSKRRRSASISMDGGCQAMEEDVPMHAPRNRKRRRIHERKQAMGAIEFNDILGQIGPISAML